MFEEGHNDVNTTFEYQKELICWQLAEEERGKSFNYLSP